MKVSLGDVAGMIAALAFVVLVLRMGSVVGKAGKVLDEARAGVREITDETVPLLREITDTVAATGQQVERLDTISSNVAAMTTNVSALTSVVSATVGRPLIKVAAFSYGVRSAVEMRRMKPSNKVGRRS
ncbi:DUF948 domain-containing protein [Flexivirga caeni]|uniref:DUF948 domain-containing protein n=1 Tax=Flexivirga caeni TaxID=2294115 RepID=A0A3M9LXN7_9MICO|nr:DUF948 domain-containing protein [Flexivirga caeni]RNI18054.1 DUF948 domain-containing protein [Flexivirga caeni]